MAEIFASNRFFASTSPQACQIRAWLLPLCVAVCSQASAAPVENQLIGRPASQSFDVRLDVAPEFFAVAKDAAGAVIVGGAEGLMINSGENWTRLPLPNSQLVRRLLSAGKRTFVGGYNSFGYVEPDQFGQYRYHELANAKLSQQTNGFADIWDLHRSDRGVFFRALREVFLVEHEALAAAKFDPMKIKSWLHEGRFGQIGADTEGQTLLQFRGEGLRRLVNEAWLPVPGTQILTDLIEVIEPINSKLTLLGGGKAPFYVYDGHQLSVAKLPPGMPDYSRISSSSRTRNRELLFGSDFGQIFIMDPDLQRVRSIPVGNGFIGRVVQDGAHLLANSITQVHQVPWPSPWSILEPLDRAGSAGFTAMSISDAGCFLHSDGGSFELKPLPGQAPLFEHEDWSASGEGAYDTMLLGQSRLIATDHELLLFAEQLSQVIDAQGYVREFYPDRFDTKIVWMASEWGIRALRTGHAQSRLGVQLSQPLPSERDSKLLSLAQLAPNEIYGTTNLHGLRRYRFTEAGAVEVLETIPLDAKIWQPLQDLYVQFDPNTQSLVLSTLAGIFRLTEQGVVLDPRFANLRAQNHRADPLQLVFDQQNILAHNQLKLFAYRLQTTQSNALQSEALTFQALEMPLSRLSAIIDVKLISPLQAFVLTNESLMALDLAGLQAHEMQPQESLRFTAVSKIDAGNQYALVPLQPAALTLQQNDLGARFEFALSGLHEPGSVQFRGKLVGYEPAFSPWAQSASYTYTRLRPGPYALQIEARDKFGRMYSAPEFALVFSPKWHDHVGTRAIALLVFASLLALLLRTAVRRRTLSLQRLIDAKTMELAGANRTLADLANLDALTGIANRRKLDSYFNAVWESARLSEHSLALLLIDADRFKQYNDAHGHAAGDELLKKLAKLIAHKLRRAEDLFARYGGEEFVVLMPGASAEIARDFAEQIRASVESAALGATISIGVASLQVSSALAPHILFERADSALYQAKAQGRNCVRCYGSELTRNS